MGKDALGDRMKAYEGIEAKRQFEKGLPVMARLDGRSFSTFTKNLERPFDLRFVNLMANTAEYVFAESNAVCAYVQSDEISLLFYPEKEESEIIFNGRIFKMTSVLASMASAYFNTKLSYWLPEKTSTLAHFDCRVWTVPDKQEATNVFVWRQLDCIKNSVASKAQSVFSHKQLHKKHQGDMLTMLSEAAEPWEDLTEQLKYGTFFRKTKVYKTLSQEELETLPEKHHARQNPDLAFERTVVAQDYLPRLVDTPNRVEVVFNAASPIIEEV